jgi:hypothetical protein
MGLKVSDSDKARLMRMAEKPKRTPLLVAGPDGREVWNAEKSAAAWTHLNETIFGKSPTITFTVPVKTVSEANVREHWAVKRERTKLQRDGASLMASMHLLRFLGTPGETARRFSITLTRIGVRALDGDNLQRALKAVRDGVADALGIDDGDSRIDWQYGQRRGGKGEYAVEVTIQGAAQ